MPPERTAVAAMEAVRDAFHRLADLGESISDEAPFVDDLRRVWGSQLEHPAREAAAASAADASAAVADALQALADEANRITDPNRAIDWLSTLPQVAAAILRRLPSVPPRRPGSAAGSRGDGPARGPDEPTGMRFADPVPDDRHALYAAIQGDPLVVRAADLLLDATLPQRLLARAAMNGEGTDPTVWRTIFSRLFTTGGPTAERSAAILAVSLAVAEKGEQARAQYRGALVEALTQRLLERRSAHVRRERRVLFDRRPAEIHPYDLTVEEPGAGEVYDCKWGARGINADVLHQLDDARRHAAEAGLPLVVGLVVFDARLSCLVRLARQTAPRRGTRLATIETLDDLTLGPPRHAAAPP